MKYLLVLLFVALASAVRYDGWQTIRITPRTDEELYSLKSYEKVAPKGVEFWREAAMVGMSVDIMVPPALTNQVKRFLDQSKLQYRIGLEDVQAVIDEQMEIIKSRPAIQAYDDDWYNRFHSAEEISDWTHAFAAEHDIVSHQVLGQTYEGYDINLLKLSTGTKQKAVYYQGGIHAREWLSPATVIYIIKQLVEDYENGVPEIVELLDTFDYYIVPQYNVDGYKYTWEGDRMWRKNRNSYPSPTGCVGVDLNRNYGHEWGGEGASDRHCGGTFHGPAPYSEIEIKIVTDYLLNLRDNEGIFFPHFIDFHTYSQLILGPWSYTETETCIDEVDQNDASQRAANALEAHYGTQYICGPSAKTLYAAAGASNDFGYAVLGAKYSYVIELRDTGDYGFLVPESQIRPSGIETYSAVKVFADQILTEFK